jgi:hypothetical protein
LREATVRDVTMTPDEIDRAHVDFLNQRVLALLDRLHMPYNPPLPVKAL